MHPITIEDALKLPYGPPPDVVVYQDYYGPFVRQAYLQAYIASNYNRDWVADVYNHVLWGAVGFVILIGIVRHFIFPLLSSRLPRPLRRAQTLAVKYLLLPPAFGTHSLEPVSIHGNPWTTMQIPNRLHSILIGLYVASNIIFYFTPYMILRPNLFYPDIGYPFTQYASGLTDRTGIMAIGSTPLVILLAGRNSPVAALTGASYSTLQIYHRWVARMTFLNGLLHTLGYSMLEALSGYFFEEFKETYWNWGWVAICGGVLLCFASLRHLREIAYEIFLILHIVGAVVWVVGCYYHVALLDPKYSYLNYIYAGIALWSLDRLIRMGRMFWLHTPPIRRSPKTGSGAFSAEGYLVGTGDLVRLRISTPTPWPARLGGPGSYVFISSPSHNIWESHPFTITWPMGVPSALSSSSESMTSTPSSEKKSLDDHPTNVFEDVDRPDSFELVIKAYGGFTRKIAKALAASDLEEGELHPVRKIKLFVDGPYGHATSLERYQSVVLVAGGTGLAATIAHLADLAKCAKRETLEVQRIVLIWVVRHAQACNILLEYLLRLQPLLPNSPHYLSVHIHYTGQATSEKSGLSEIQDILAPASPFASITVHVGRPAIGPYIDEVASLGQGKIALSVCGPTGLCDTSREAVRSRMGKDGHDAETLAYHEESFTW